MGDRMTFPATFDEFAEQYKIVDKQEIYTNGTALIPIFRVKQWLENADVAPRAEVGEHLEDLLTEFDEFGMQPTILVPDPEGMAIEWKRKLEYAIGLIKAEVAREIFEEIEFDIHQLMFDREETRAIAIEGIIANLKKKYTEGEK